MADLIIFTDMDGTLLDSEDYSYAPALPMLRRLQAAGIPVIPVTSKTRAEVETFCGALNITDPFIVENGSGVFFPQDYSKFQLPPGEPWQGYHLVQFGCTYAEARTGLAAIAQTLNTELQGFGDLSIIELLQLTGLSELDAHQAKAREFTEPFITPKDIPAADIKQAGSTHGFRIVVGDRFSHLIGHHAGKGIAAQKLTQLYQSALPTETPITTIGLGNSPNDLDMLEVVDIPIIVPGKQGPHPGLVGRNWQVAPAPGPQGWAKVLEQVCDGVLK